MLWLEIEFGITTIGEEAETTATEERQWNEEKIPQNTNIQIQLINEINVILNLLNT